MGDQSISGKRKTSYTTTKKNEKLTDWTARLRKPRLFFFSLSRFPVKIGGITAAGRTRADESVPGVAQTRSTSTRNKVSRENLLSAINNRNVNNYCQCQRDGSLASAPPVCVPVQRLGGFVMFQATDERAENGGRRIRRRRFKVDFQRPLPGGNGTTRHWTRRSIDTHCRCFDWLQGSSDVMGSQ